MYTQVVFKYAGTPWQCFGPMLTGSTAQDSFEECQRQHPSAMVGVVEGFTLDDVEGKLDILYSMGDSSREEGPRDVPIYEAGPGGDHDTPYTYTPPPDGPLLAKWVQIMAKVRRGEVGGPDDGGEDDQGVRVA